MELMHALNSRRSVRVFCDRPVDRATVDTLINAAIQAPTAMNLQPWAFVVVQDAELINRCGRRATDYFLEVMTPDSPAYAIRNTIASPDYNVFHRAPALIIICSKPGGLLPLEDCCFAAQNLVLAAQALGLGTCPVGFARPWLSLAEVKRELGIPEDCVPAVPIILGYPGQDPPPPGRRPAEIIALGSPVPSGAASYALQPA